MRLISQPITIRDWAILNDTLDSKLIVYCSSLFFNIAIDNHNRSQVVIERYQTICSRYYWITISMHQNFCSISQEAFLIKDSLHSSRICNETYSKTTSTTEELISRILPNLLQSHILCAGTDIGKQGSCLGDSGGPLMIFNRTTRICKFKRFLYFSQSDVLVAGALVY